MASEYIKANWKQIRGAVKMKWGDLRDDDIARAEGQRELLEGLLMEKYGYTKAVAQRKLQEVIDAVKEGGGQLREKIVPEKTPAQRR